MTRLALDAERSVERVREAIDDRKTEPRASGLARQASVRLPEWIEDARLILGDDTNSRVHDLDPKTRHANGRAKGYLTLVRVLERVGEQVQDDLAYLAHVRDKEQPGG